MNEAREKTGWDSFKETVGSAWDWLKLNVTKATKTIVDSVKDLFDWISNQKYSELYFLVIGIAALYYLPIESMVWSFALVFFAIDAIKYLRKKYFSEPQTN